MTLESTIEAVLFYKTEPVKMTHLAEILAVSEDELKTALARLQEALKERGVRLSMTDTEVQLVAAAEAGSTIDALRKEELKSDIGKAGAETLAIILYRGPLSRSEIDRIRGVNSTFIIRNLLIRGLVERRAHPTDARSFVYAGTPALLNHLGIDGRESLPDFGDIMGALDAFEEQEVAHAKAAEESQTTETENV